MGQRLEAAKPRIFTVKEKLASRCPRLFTHLDPPHASLCQAWVTVVQMDSAGPRAAHQSEDMSAEQSHRQRGTLGGVAGSGKGPREVRVRRGWSSPGWEGAGPRAQSEQRPRGGREGTEQEGETKGGSCTGVRTGTSEEAGDRPGPAATLASLVLSIGAAGWCWGPRPSSDETLGLLNRDGLGSGCGRVRCGREKMRGGNTGLDGTGQGRAVDNHRYPGGMNRHHLVMSQMGDKRGQMLPEAKSTEPGQDGPASRERDGSRPGRLGVRPREG